MNVLVARVAGKPVAFSASEVVRVALRPRLQELPQQPSWMLGLTQYGKQVVAVVDLAQLMGWGELLDSLYSHVIFVSIEEQLVGLAVERASDVLELHPEELHPLPANSTFHGVAAAVFPIGDELVPLLVPRLLLLKEEREKLAWWTQVEATRT